MTEENGHKTLYLPLYHPNAIQMLWSRIKNWVADHNVIYKMAEIKEDLLPQVDAMIDKEFLMKIYYHVCQDCSITINNINMTTV